MLYIFAGIAFLVVCCTAGPATAFGLGVLCVGVALLGGPGR